MISRRTVVAMISCSPASALAQAAGPHQPTATAERFMIRTPRAVQEASFVPIGGIEQWITLRGEDRRNPVMLMLAGPGGGPGQVLSPLAMTFQPWERDYTLAQWDYRGAGKTFARAGKKAGPELTIDRLLHDGLEVAEYVRRRTGKRKIVLLGSAFGSTLGLRMIQARPDICSVYVGAGQVVSTAADREQFFYDRLMQQLVQAGDQAGIADVSKAGPHPWGDTTKAALMARVYLRYRPPVPDQRAVARNLPPEWTLADVAAVREGAILADRVLLPEYNSFDAAVLGRTFRVPLVMIQGEDDRFHPTPLAKSWLDHVSAPAKRFDTIAGAGNHEMETHTAEFLQKLNRHVRPLT